ncbi:hypothetical protein OnM2_031009 [Erysiphe neolycopersici]|uniref:Uncharacterized protein n=1 Tax=Erysiphe neolycopersici TaxID=212602 RepID=A0A420HYZ6_9PEZI|nr:hypothetical protein OnM2_031009 [Erysiphe neolycopersici]
MAPPLTPSPHRFTIKNDTPGSVLAGSQFNTTRRFNFTPTSQTKSFKETPKFVLNPLNLLALTENKIVKNDNPKFSLSSSDFLIPTGKKTAHNEIPKFILNSSDFKVPTGIKPTQNEIPKFVLNPAQPQVSNGKKLCQGDSIEIESDNSSESGITLNEESDTAVRSESESKSEIIEEPASKRRKKLLLPRSFEKSSWLKNEASKLRIEYDDVLLPLPVTPTLPSPKPQKIDQIRVPRFLISLPDQMSTSRVMNENLIFAKPPVFRPPDPTTQQDLQSDPNPDLFSPHRRGEKYIIGGLAAELRNWLVNIKSSSPTFQKGGKDPWLVEILVEDLNANSKIGMILVKGRRLQTTGVEKKEFVSAVKIILANEISSIGLQKSSNVEKGMKIGIRGPIWEVTIENEKWGVGVDWKVI